MTQVILAEKPKSPRCLVYIGTVAAMMLVVVVTCSYMYFDVQSMPQVYLAAGQTGDERIETGIRDVLENQLRIIKRVDDLQAMMNASNVGENIEKKEEVDFEHFVQTLTPEQKRKISNSTKSTIERVKLYNFAEIILSGNLNLTGRKIDAKTFIKKRETQHLRIKTAGVIECTKYKIKYICWFSLV